MNHSSSSTAVIDDVDYVSSFIGQRLAAKGLLQSPVRLRRYCQGGEDPDSKLVFLSEGDAGFVVTVSPPQFPEVVAEECLKVAQMRSRLGDLGGPIREPLDTGRIPTSSYAVLPYRRPFSRRRATAALLRTADAHLHSGRFVPRVAPMHGDLWGGNVLRGNASTAFTLIDWRGSATEGFPIFDLIRVADSFDLPIKALRRELRRHCAALGCQMADLPLYLLGALGHYAAHLGEMSPALFRTMADACATRFSHAMEALAPSVSV